METLSVNTTTQAVPTPVTYTAPTAKTPSPTPVVRMDTNPADATEKNENVDMPKLTAKLNKVAELENLDISFGYNEKIDRVIINVLDKNTGEVIRKLPSEDAVKFAEGMEDMLGKLFDSKG